MLNLHAVDIWSQLTVIIDGTIAAVLGSIIGWERDRAGKSAGPRTMALVGASAAVFVVIGELLDTSGMKYGDPTRAMHGVITGIGFLGAGLIFNSKRHGVQGVTTAATVFSTATMGVAVGLGFQLAGVGFALVIIVILRSTQVLELAARRQEYEYEE
ncbi:MAG TPA: MgtC/SapB family protein [Candidatus Nanopelagicaceae bacterium]|nr:MgtC/SapB family protein [Candidatus Nanopelagicaceae bacterium]